MNAEPSGKNAAARPSPRTGAPRGGAGLPQAPACTMVVFGAAGDLTRRLIMPALYNLVRAGRLPEEFRLIGVDLAQGNTGSWREQLGKAIAGFARSKTAEFHAAQLDRPSWEWLMQRCEYQQGDFDNAAAYRALRSRLAPGTNALFYLAIGERFFANVIERLGHEGFVAEATGKWRRVIVEKPFGHDAASAAELNSRILRILREDQVFRIDHFVGKEAVQNIMVQRFANSIFEPLWTRDHIEYVEITAAETVGVEHRGKFYERTGALRDMVPNHLFQLLAMIGMEPPVSFDASSVRTKKAELFEAVAPIAPRDAVRGQYGAGRVLGASVGAYREQPDVARDSITETYVALKLAIDNWRWADVPFYLRTGKCLGARATHAVIHFRRPPHLMFRDTPVERLPHNELRLRIQPREGLAASINLKRPGPQVSLAGVTMDLAYEDYFGPSTEVGYETLIYDCTLGDATLFQRADAVEAAWRAVDPVLQAWALPPQESFPNYGAGSSGPAEAEALMARDGRAWSPIFLAANAGDAGRK